jgi:predicted DNA-binding transcriptional regulator AlpA
MTTSEWWSPEDLAEWLGLPVATVYAWNYKSTGPRYIRAGKHVRYRRSDVEACASERTQPAAAGGASAA